MNSIQIYDFEGNVPDIIAVAFAAFVPFQLNAITTNIPPDFQKLRPRSELVFKPSGTTSPPRIMTVQGWGRVIANYEGDLEIDLITEPSLPGKAVHAAYRAAVRLIMELDRLRTAVNLNTSPYQIDFVLPTGATDAIKTDQGYETSKLTYHIQFSIKQDAFNQLAQSIAA